MPPRELGARRAVAAQALPHEGAQRLARDQLHGEKVLSALGAAGLVDGGDEIDSLPSRGRSTLRDADHFAGAPIDQHDKDWSQ